MSQPYDPLRLQETITLHNGATLTRVRGGDWSVEGELPDLFPFHNNDSLDQAIAASRQELAASAQPTTTSWASTSRSIPSTPAP